MIINNSIIARFIFYYKQTQVKKHTLYTILYSKTDTFLTNAQNQKKKKDDFDVLNRFKICHRNTEIAIVNICKNTKIVLVICTNIYTICD